MKKKYAIPISLEIDDENPDKRARQIADKIYEVVNDLADDMEEEGLNYFDMAYSIYVKPDAATFGN